MLEHPSFRPKVSSMGSVSFCTYVGNRSSTPARTPALAKKRTFLYLIMHLKCDEVLKTLNTLVSIVY